MSKIKRIKKRDNYYSRVSAVVSDDADKIVKLFETIGGEGTTALMYHYFARYWAEFVEFWRQSGEVVDWVTFALIPHNAHWFITYVFQEYPDVRKMVMTDYTQAMEAEQNDAR